MKEKTYHLGVKAFIQDNDGKVLLLQRGYWDLPGGRIQERETVEETLRREVAEETGIVDFEMVSPLDTIISDVEIPLKEGGSVGLILSIYACRIQKPIEISLSTEHTNYSWVSPEEACSLLLERYPATFKEKVSQL